MKMTPKKFKSIVEEYYSVPRECKYVLAVDFDHTLCDSKFPYCGDEIKPICDFVRAVQDLNIIIIITTCREGNMSVVYAKSWLSDHKIRWDYFNENDPNRIELYRDCRKIYCDMLIDDTAYNFNIKDFERGGAV